MKTPHTKTADNLLWSNDQLCLKVLPVQCSRASRDNSRFGTRYLQRETQQGGQYLYGQAKLSLLTTNVDSENAPSRSTNCTSIIHSLYLFLSSKFGYNFQLFVYTSHPRKMLQWPLQSGDFLIGEGLELSCTSLREDKI